MATVAGHVPTGPHATTSGVPRSSTSPMDLRPSLLDQVQSQASSPQDLLRRMSLFDGEDGRPTTATEPTQTSIEELGLSGNVISATFCVPYQIGLRQDTRDWIVDGRKGTSALFDSFSYLASSESKWRHTLVGWTGEIESMEQQDFDEHGQRRDPEQFNSQLFSNTPQLARYKSAQSKAISQFEVAPAEKKKLDTELETLQGGRVTPVWLPDQVHEDDSLTLGDQQRWRRYGEHELFTLFHYKQKTPTDGKDTKKAWGDYVRMNEAFADRIMEVYTPGDIIVVYDYHLFLLPELLRRRLPNAYISFFLHIPFPSMEVYRCLTKRKEILRGLLSANVIGFQTKDYPRHFANCCDYFKKDLSCNATPASVTTPVGSVMLEVCAIGVNTATTLREAFESSDVASTLKQLETKLAGQKVIVGRDRLDSIRGVAQKLQAFEMFLKKYPQWRGKVTLIQITSPTSIADRDGKNEKNETQIMELVWRVNSTYGSFVYTPVHYLPKYLPKHEYFAALRVADLGLITSTRDGMNTTALEYVICQQTKQSPLMISEFSGTADSLGAAIQINPWDMTGVANAISRALTMGDTEKTKSHSKLFDHVIENGVQEWTRKFIERVITDLQMSGHTVNTPALDFDALTASHRKSQHRLFMLDYDGTLTNIVGDPDAAIPNDRILRTLTALAADKHNSVWIVSGRPQSFLQEYLGHIDGLGLSAEHGCFMRKPGDDEWNDLTTEMDLAWQQKVIEIFSRYTLGDGSGTHLERKRVALTWHYRRADPEWSADAAKECLKELQEKVEPYYEVDVMKGKMNLEVRPRFVNKGEIAKRLVAGFKGLPPPDFVVSMGDDHTDEDMFRALRQSKLPEGDVFGVTVGPSSKQTLASYHVFEPSDVLGVLEAVSNSGAVNEDTNDHAYDQGTLDGSSPAFATTNGRH